MSDIQEQLTKVEITKQINDALSNADFSKYQEIKIKLKIDELDLTDCTSYKKIVETKWSKYTKESYNLMSKKTIQEVCEVLSERLNEDQDLKQYSYFFKPDKTGIFNKVDKTNRKFSQIGRAHV